MRVEAAEAANGKAALWCTRAIPKFNLPTVQGGLCILRDTHASEIAGQARDTRI